jgi:hypothetical protein
MKKENNSRRYPGESCNHRPDEAAKRRSEAQARQEITDALTPRQRLDNLDIKFGVGEGAKKERVRLAAIAAKPPVQKTVSLALQTKAVAVAGAKRYEELEMQTLPDEVMEEIAALNEENNGKKKLKAKDRRARESNNG